MAICTYLNILLNTWEDAFPLLPLEEKHRLKGKKQISINDFKSVWIHTCLFQNISSNTDGGAILDQNSKSILIEETSFISINGLNGGAFFRGGEGYRGQCILIKICGYECYCTNSNEQRFIFSYSTAFSNDKSMNCMNITSIVHCTKKFNKGKYLIGFISGNAISQNDNVSCNNVQYFSFGVLESYSDNLLFTSVVNNTSEGGCIKLNSAWGSSNVKALVDSCDILDNDYNGVLWFQI